MNVVNPIEGYQRGVCEICALLTRKEQVTTQTCEVCRRICPDELELLLFRLEEGPVRRAASTTRLSQERAQRVIGRDEEDAFRGNVREDI